MDALKAAGVGARYYEIGTELGHSASGHGAEKWAPTLKNFIAELID
jgi:hypothetical protein